MIWVLIGFLICMVAGCYAAYKEAKIHELHKMRAAFEDKKRDIERLMNNEMVSSDGEVEEILKGEFLGLSKVLSMLHEEGADKDLVDEIKKDLEELKEKIEGLFNK